MTKKELLKMLQTDQKDFTDLKQHYQATAHKNDMDKIHFYECSAILVYVELLLQRAGDE